MPYTLSINDRSYLRAKKYLIDLISGEAAPGARLKHLIDKDGVILAELQPYQFLELLANTKAKGIFAESQVYCDGRDWNKTEALILSDLVTEVDVSIFDNGIHDRRLPSFQAYDPPHQGKLLFVSAPLFRNDRTKITPDLYECTTNKKFDQGKYNHLVERRLLPAFAHLQESFRRTGKKFLFTIPGWGCGQFAGKRQGKMGKRFQIALQTFLANHPELRDSIAAIYYDPYSECEASDQEINDIPFYTRPLAHRTTTDPKPQLCPVGGYLNGDYRNCQLATLVAADAFSHAGTDFFRLSRKTDEGVKAAATDSMTQFSGIPGKYDKTSGKYLPEEKNTTWRRLFKREDFELSFATATVCSSDGTVIPIQDYEGRTCNHRFAKRCLLIDLIQKSEQLVQYWGGKKVPGNLAQELIIDSSMKLPDSIANALENREIMQHIDNDTVSPEQFEKHLYDALKTAINDRAKKTKGRHTKTTLFYQSIIEQTATNQIQTRHLNKACITP
ncbi:hypothetical protein [Piscirickettsia salmonis]|uniref:hypothetical protein n=1 Tax=Piscirickettsia salmonis TaxID=1238 RepID=UPI00031EA99E|nr:hypothetical protein [Piscirickettsia salmonis]APS55922.1 hypothetical protein AVI52_00800 [Piscirickettsia salmonis]ERL61821.1 hypothetical protein K661_01828 [Piscirickettsia salmonis LF-89 = ATCC VR-1361]PEQ16212.1 hypothetical protein X973_08630 [Piscirickettsia salmonis]QGN77051.1 hypothetical protein Psal001_01254 [Piscirickettsia salmonis]QGN80640.1 hypothetical protein Psal002_01278 [Piscirickettsia salmonis]